MVIVEAQTLNSVVHSIYPLMELTRSWLTDGLVLAQQVEDPDVLGQMQQAFKNFIDSGQVWALLIGIVIGYIFRGMGSFG